MEDEEGKEVRRESNARFVIASNKRQNSWTEQVQTLCSNTHDRREGLKNA